MRHHLRLTIPPLQRARRRGSGDSGAADHDGVPGVQTQCLLVATVCTGKSRHCRHLHRCSEVALRSPGVPPSNDRSPRLCTGLVGNMDIHVAFQWAGVE